MKCKKCGLSMAAGEGKDGLCDFCSDNWTKPEKPIKK